MNIGRMDTLITIESFTTTENDYGEKVRSYTNETTAWVERVKQSSGESVESDQIVGNYVEELITHRQEGIDKTMRVVMEGDYYDIIDIDYTDRKKMVLIVEKKDNQ